MSSYSSRSSPHQDRIYQISERLAGIQVTIENERGSRVDQLESKIDILQQRFEEAQEQNAKKFSNCKDQVSFLQKSLNDTIESRENFFQQRTNELLDREEALKGYFGESDTSKKEADVKLQKLMDDRMNSLKAEVSREAKLRSDGLDSIKQYFNERIPTIESMLKNEVIEREKVGEQYMNDINKEVERAQGLIDQERKAREETEEAMLVMLQDLVSRMKNEIEAERGEREESEETLLNLLEETCGKLNSLSKY